MLKLKNGLTVFNFLQIIYIHKTLVQHIHIFTYRRHVLLEHLCFNEGNWVNIFMARIVEIVCSYYTIINTRNTIIFSVFFLSNTFACWKSSIKMFIYMQSIFFLWQVVKNEPILAVGVHSWIENFENESNLDKRNWTDFLKGMCPKNRSDP